MIKPLTQQKILLVEDVEENRGIVRQLLARMGVTLVEAGDGAEGVQLARRERPDLILMDLSLPVMDGWQATRVIKGDPQTASIPVVALTAHAMSGDEQKAREAGCDGYVAKPLDLVEFQRYLERVLGGGRP